MKRMSQLVVASLFVSLAPLEAATKTLQPPEWIPDSLRVPPGHELFLQALALGCRFTIAKLPRVDSNGFCELRRPSSLTVVPSCSARTSPGRAGNPWTEVGWWARGWPGRTHRIRSLFPGYSSKRNRTMDPGCSAK